LIGAAADAGLRTAELVELTSIIASDYVQDADYLRHMAGV
jgi:hypothetical protein